MPKKAAYILMPVCLFAVITILSLIFRLPYFSSFSSNRMHDRMPWQTQELVYTQLHLSGFWEQSLLPNATKCSGWVFVNVVAHQLRWSVPLGILCASWVHNVIFWCKDIFQHMSFKNKVFLWVWWAVCSLFSNKQRILKI